MLSFGSKVSQARKFRDKDYKEPEMVKKHRPRFRRLSYKRSKANLRSSLLRFFKRLYRDALLMTEQEYEDFANDLTTLIRIFPDSYTDLAERQQIYYFKCKLKALSTNPLELRDHPEIFAKICEDQASELFESHPSYVIIW